MSTFQIPRCNILILSLALLGGATSSYAFNFNLGFWKSSFTPPPDPINLTANYYDLCYAIGDTVCYYYPTTYCFINAKVSWNSGGGDTVSYKYAIDYSSIPANCNVGYTTGTTTSTSILNGDGMYIRVCAVDSFGNVSKGVTVTQGGVGC